MGEVKAKETSQMMRLMMTTFLCVTWRMVVWLPRLFTRWDLIWIVWLLWELDNNHVDNLSREIEKFWWREWMNDEGRTNTAVFSDYASKWNEQRSVLASSGLHFWGVWVNTILDNWGAQTVSNLFSFLSFLLRVVFIFDVVLFSVIIFNFGIICIFCFWGCLYL